MTSCQYFYNFYPTNLISLIVLTIIVIIAITTSTTRMTIAAKITIENNFPMNFITQQEEKILSKSLNNVVNVASQMYELRFSTIQFKPRFLRYKLQQQQQVADDSINNTTTPANQSMEVEEEEEEEVVVDDGDVESGDDTVEMSTTMATIEESTIMPTESNVNSDTGMTSQLSTMQAMTTTTTTPSSSSISTMATGKPFLSSTTATTSTISNTFSIMKPSSSLFLPFNLKEKLMNFFFAPTTETATATTTTTTKRKKGFLSLFEIIKFENKPCLVALANIRPMEGICYHELECKNLGGISTDRCADGAGVCCIFVTGCGDTTSQLITYFESTNYPKPMQDMLMCVLIINLKETTQQLRLDFIVFELNRPLDGDCLDDQFIISGHDINFQVPILCGINSGQHLYVHVKNALNRKVYITISSKTTLGSRIFNMKITQLEQNIAPEGCLQYFPESEGILKSFNYDVVGTVVDNREATYLNNLNYAICIKRLKNYCTIIYKMEQDPYLANSDDKGQIDFQIVNKDEEGNDLVPVGQAGAGIFNCPEDFIAINQVRLCGERFNDGAVNEDFTMNAFIRDVTAGPIVMPFRTNHLYVGRGFRLVYTQELCV